MLENCVKDTFNQVMKTTFKESMPEEPVYSTYVMPKEKSIRDTTIFAQLKFNRWLVNRFKIEGMNSDIFGFYEGVTEGRNSDKAVYVRAQMGTILDFAVPNGFLLTENKKFAPLQLSGAAADAQAVGPLLQLVQTDLKQNKSKLNMILKSLPEKTKYKVGGLTGKEWEFEQKPILAVVPRQGKTIVGVVFLSHLPGGKKTKGTKIQIQEQKYEIGAPFGANLANAYHLIRYFQDIPDVCKTDTPQTSEIPMVQDFAKNLRGSIFEFLALEVAREKYSPTSPPISLKDFLTLQENVLELEKQLNGDYEDIKLAKWGVT